MNTTYIPAVTIGMLIEKKPVAALRKTAFVAGLLYLLTFVSIPTIALYGPLHETGVITGASPDTPAVIGALLEIVVALAGIATAIILYPVLRKRSEGLALGLVASRILEACTMFVGVAFILAVITLRHAGMGTEGLTTSQALIVLYDRIFLLGQSFIPGLNDVMLGLLLYRSRLVPRGLAMLGIMGAAPLLAGYVAMLFGLIGPHSIAAGIAALPVALFEFSLGVYLVIKGFRTPTS